MTNKITEGIVVSDGRPGIPDGQRERNREKIIELTNQGKRPQEIGRILGMRASSITQIKSLLKKNGKLK